MAGKLPMIVKEPAAPEMTQMPEVALGEDMASFLSRCVVDPVMMGQHSNASDRRAACEMLWASDQMDSEAGDMPPMMEDSIAAANGNPGIIPAEHRAVPIVYFNQRAEQKRRVGKPGSEVGNDGKRHSVRLIG